MKRVLEKDILGGILLIAISLFAIGAMQSLPLGTMRQMGPGFFPMAVAGILGLFGVAQVSIGILRRDERMRIAVGPVLLILGGIAVFALLIGRVGLIPSVCALVVTVSFADHASRPVPVVLLCVALSAIAVGLFRFALGLQIPLVAWAF